MVTIVRKWWKEGIVYQVWPASYKDSNGDGIGDIPGIISTLDYLKALGVDIIWLSPAFASPQKDMGYDISDYKDIDPRYGTLIDTERLLEECHKRGMRLLFDLVVNHTSDQHAWFKESATSRNNPKADWYIWRDGKIDANGNRKEPNNWGCWFGGSAWQWVEARKQYYLHLFAAEQPDLNWEQAETRQAIYEDAIKFWLDKGIDGFRIDTVCLYSKPTEFVDSPIIDSDAEYQFEPDAWYDGPRIHEFVNEMYEETFAHYDTMTVGELGSNDLDEIKKYVSPSQRQLDMVFQMDAVMTGKDNAGDTMVPVPTTLTEFKNAWANTQRLAADPHDDAWGTVFLENHDQPRSISRFGVDEGPFRARAAKLLAMLQVASSGTLFLYQGQEIGVHNLPADWPLEDYRDIQSANYVSEYRRRSPQDPNAGQKKALAHLHHRARDHARYPMPWTRDAPHGGFTDSSATPWMPVHPDFAAGWNIAKQLHDPESVMSFWKSALRLRKERPGVFTYGAFRTVPVGGDTLFVFEKQDAGCFDAATAHRPEPGAQPNAAHETSREEGDSRLVVQTSHDAKVLVILNFSSSKQTMQVEQGIQLGDVLLGNVHDGRGDPMSLEPWEGRIYEVV